MTVPCALCYCGPISHWILCIFPGWYDCYTHPGYNCTYISGVDS